MDAAGFSSLRKNQPFP